MSSRDLAQSSSRASRTARARTATAIATAVALVAALVGCGSSDSGSTTTAAPSSTSAGALQPLQQTLIDVVKTVSPEVVQIDTPTGLGSGVVFDDKGDIVTNAHVVGSYQQFGVIVSGSGQQKATLVGSYPQGDIAVVRLTDSTPHPPPLPTPPRFRWVSSRSRSGTRSGFGRASPTGSFRPLDGRSRRATG